jgi:peptidoglycan/xylan/chitin deacetylase (PgdA/CDA1 family)
MAFDNPEAQAVHAVNGNQMTRPDSLFAYARQLALRSGFDRIRPLAYARAEAGIRCLTFHYLFDHEMDHAYDLFRALKSQGDFITTAELLALLDRPARIGDRLFHLSIDDGFENIATNAHPLLRDLAIPYTMFVCPELIDGGPAAEEQFRINAGYRRRLALATWRTLKVLAADGIEIGCHTATHRSVASLAEQELDRELVRSKAMIESRIGKPCISFAWPFGRLDTMTAPALLRAREAGYQAVFSSVRGSLVSGRGVPPYISRHHFEPSWPRCAVLYYATRKERCFTIDPRFTV